MNQILSNIQKVVDDSVLLFTLKVSEKYNVDQNDLYNLWKELCGNDGNDSGDEIKKPSKRKIKKKTPKPKKEKVVKSPLEKKKISELKKMCKELGLKKYSSLKKKQLVELLQNNEKQEIEKQEPPLEEVLDNVLDNVLEDMGNLDITGELDKKEDKKEDFNEDKKEDFNEEEKLKKY